MNTEQKIIKNKVGLLKLSEMLGSVSEACNVMGYSRGTFRIGRSVRATAHRSCFPGHLRVSFVVYGISVPLWASRIAFDPETRMF
jgi:hypothetical protein